MRSFRSFSFRGAHYRINGEAFDAASAKLVRLRKELERYIALVPSFASSLVPFPALPQRPPESAVRMNGAAASAGVGPMAAVAGTFAALAGEAALKAGCREAVVENGGDMFIMIRDALTVGLFAGAEDSSPFGNLAFRIEPSAAPLAVCSSSSTMGHSMSFGKADLVTVFSADASIADAAATRGANQVDSPDRIGDVVEMILALEGVRGVLVIAGGKLAMGGDLPSLIRHTDPAMALRVSHDEESDFPLRPSRKP
jgi:ApbE superfamily uncharacterized protein (UPF0280 family)